MDLGKDLLGYFEAVNPEEFGSKKLFDYPQILDQVNFLEPKSSDSILDQSQLVVVGYPGCKESMPIRKHLYSLSSHFKSGKLLDLGNIKKGKTKADTERGFTDVISDLGKRQKTIIILGGLSFDTFKLYQAYSKLENPVNICSIDAGIPLSNSVNFSKNHYLNKILLNPKNNLFDFTHLAYQAYFTDPDVLELLDQLHFKHIRLGEIRNDIREAEPEFRNSDILSFSMSSIRASDAPSSSNPGPNGLYAEEACQLGRYAGLSERLSCFSINDMPLQKPDNQLNSSLSAQIVWHFIQGFFQRKKEFPYSDISTFQKFIVNVPQVGHNINFFKSPKTGRWWLEVPYPAEKHQRSLYVACSPADYQQACDGEIPDRWWKNFQRLS